ncbi:MAG TPA: TIGR01777 family oxidoreductase [Chthonomonadaceae bacterium]|nr:TIGR01777 family oxidoreductase [Chthonomonadaceae bacterium]
MKIVIPGGTGQIGVLLARAFHFDGNDVVVLSRTPAPAPWRIVRWDGRTYAREWADEIDGARVVINLAGKSVNCRYNAANRREIRASRVDSVRAVAEAIVRASHPPKVWLQASTATIYAHRLDAGNDESSGTLGGGELPSPPKWQFSTEVACAWESALVEAVTPYTRKVALRSAMTMSPDRGGVFDTLLTLVRRGLGGTAGSGRQYVSWIHEADFVRAVAWIIAHERVAGPINLAAPNPVPNAEFMRAIREAWGQRRGLPAPEWLLEVGALFLGTETELVLKSRRVVPRLLLDAGFRFAYPDWPEAAQELCDRVRNRG